LVAEQSLLLFDRVDEKTAFRRQNSGLREPFRKLHPGKHCEMQMG